MSIAQFDGFRGVSGSKFYCARAIGFWLNLYKKRFPCYPLSL